MSTYLLTFTKIIPLHDGIIGSTSSIVTLNEPWHTTIGAEDAQSAESIAIEIGNMVKNRLPEFYDIKLDSVELVC